MIGQWDTDGYVVSEPIFSAAECDELVRLSSEQAHSEPRNLLAYGWCRSVAERLATSAPGTILIPADAEPVQCTYFEKSHRRNWLVTLHQDLSIPVAERVASEALSVWSVKAGVLYAQPPASVLSQLVAVRLQLDAPARNDGSLRVVRGTHVHGRLGDEDAFALRAEIGETTCVVQKGAALFMRPLLLHASSQETRSK